MFEDLAKLGLIPKKAARIIVPHMDTELFSYFLRGYFDGDGCVNFHIGLKRNKGRLVVIFTSCCQEFLDDVYQRLGNILQIESRQPYFQQHAYRLTYQGSKAIKVLGYIYQDLGGSPYLDRKYKIYRTFISNN